MYRPVGRSDRVRSLVAGTIWTTGSTLARDADPRRMPMRASSRPASGAKGSGKTRAELANTGYWDYQHFGTSSSGIKRPRDSGLDVAVTD